MPKLILESLSPSGNLSTAIARKLQRLEEKSIKEKTVIFSGVLLACLLLLVQIVLNLRHSLEMSGFMTYVSLLFSDFSSVVPAFKEFGFSLLESLPLFTLALGAALLSAVLWSLVSLSGLVLRRRGWHYRVAAH